MFNRRKSYLEGSYTGVSAFSSAPAPNNNALAAASVIGDALKANNYKAQGLNLPQTQTKRSNTLRGIAAAQPPMSRSASIRTDNRSPQLGRSVSIQSSRQSLYGMPKQRLQNQRSSPSLGNRRSVSDMQSYVNARTGTATGTGTATATRTSTITSSSTNVPKMIKRYVPSANGLVAIEVPNPKHPDNATQQQRQFSRSASLNMKRRSVSLNSPAPVYSSPNARTATQNHYPPTARTFATKEQQNAKGQGQAQTQSQSQLPSLKNRRSITTTESKVLPNGTTIATTTVEEYIEDDDEYVGFDDDIKPIIEENDDDDVIVDNTLDYENSQNELKEEQRLKRLIKHNENLEKRQRERAFSSIDEPIEMSTVEEPSEEHSVISDVDSYSQEEKMLAEQKLAELVAIKEKEILSKFIEQTQLNKIGNDSVQTQFSATEEEKYLTPATAGDSENSADVDSTAFKNIANSIAESSTSVTGASVAESDLEFKEINHKSMAQHLRPIIKQKVSRINTTLDGSPKAISHREGQEQEQGEAEEQIHDKEQEVAELEIPKRSPDIQAQIDFLQNHSEPDESFTEPLKLEPTESNSTVQKSLIKRKSVLKNANSSSRYSTVGSNGNGDNMAYVSLTTAENTRLNAMGSSLSVHRQTSNLTMSSTGGLNKASYANTAANSTRRQSISNMPESVVDGTSLSAASKAAGKRLNGVSNQAASKASLRNSISTPNMRSNPKVEDAKRRILADRPAKKKAKELYEISKSRPVVKESDLVALNEQDSVPHRSSFEKSGGNGKDNLKRMTLRGDGDYEKAALEHSLYVENNRDRSRFKSRFNDSDSDFEVPLMSKQDNKMMLQTPEKNKKKFGFSTAGSNGSSPAKTSKFGKFFTEPAGKRHVSSASSKAPADGEKKKGFGKLKKIFGSKK